MPGKKTSTPESKSSTGNKAANSNSLVPKNAGGGTKTGASKQAIASVLTAKNAANKTSSNTGNVGTKTGASKIQIAQNIANYNKSKNSTLSANSKTENNAGANPNTKMPSVGQNTYGAGNNNMTTQDIPAAEVDKVDQIITNIYQLMYAGDAAKNLTEKIKLIDQLSRKRKLSTFLKEFEIKGVNTRTKWTAKLNLYYELVKAVSNTSLGDKVLGEQGVKQFVRDIITIFKADKEEWKYFGNTLKAVLGGLITDPALRQKVWEGIMSGEALKEGWEWNKLMFQSIHQSIYNFAESKFDVLGLNGLFDDLVKQNNGGKNILESVTGLFGKLDTAFQQFLTAQLLPNHSSAANLLTPPSQATIYVPRQCVEPKPAGPLPSLKSPLNDLLNVFEYNPGQH